MNIFNFNKKGIYAPVDGVVVDITQVADKVFSEKMMGDGFAIKPSNNIITSPVNGKIVNVFKTKHAMIITDENGLEIIIHVGLDTVQLKGEGFNVNVVEGQVVKVGDPLMEADFDFIKEKGKDTIILVVITNMENVNNIKVKEGKCKASNKVLTYK